MVICRLLALLSSLLCGPLVWRGITGNSLFIILPWGEISPDPTSALVTLGAALILLLLPANSKRMIGLLAWTSALLLVLASLILWTGGFHTSWISLTSPGAPSWLALGFALVANLGAWVRPVRKGRPEVGWLLLGAVAAFASASLFERAEETRLVAKVSAIERPPAPGGAANVILVVVDTLRADALGTYGADQAGTPTIDALANASAVFLHTSSQAPWTLPSMASFMTSLYPSAWDDTVWSGPGHRLIPKGQETLAGAFQSAGWLTIGLVTNPWLDPNTGLASGFDVYEVVRARDTYAVEAEKLTARASEIAPIIAAEAQKQYRPIFLYLHYFDPHSGYEPPAEFLPETRPIGATLSSGAHAEVEALAKRGDGWSQGDIEFLKELYAGEVRYFDREFGTLLNTLRTTGILNDQTTLVLTSDHGEQFGEHGEFFHGDMHSENVHVPLLIRNPRLPPIRVTGPTSLLDVTPTLLSLHGLPPMRNTDGRVLTPTEIVDGVSITEQGEERRISNRDWTLIRRGEKVSLFDRTADPEEAHDIATQRPRVVATLEQALASHDARVTSLIPAIEEKEGRVDGRTREALRALGYLE